MAVQPGRRRVARGEIERLPSGSLRVRVYAGIDPATKKRRYRVETVPAGATAERDAEAARLRLLHEVGEQRGPQPAGGRPLSEWPVPGREAADPAPAAAQESPAAAHRRGRRRGELTVATVARLAGVSAPTVSKVLNGRPGVAAETRRRVETALREHGYRRPGNAVQAAHLEVVFYGMQSSLAISVLHGVEQVAGAHSLAVSFTDALQQASAGRTWAREVLARRPTAVIAVHFGFSSEQHALLTAGGIPLVALDSNGEPEIPSVGATNFSGGADATRHLLELGHRRIAVLTGPADRLCARERLEGVRAAMDDAGIALDDALVRAGQWFAFEDGLSFGRELLRLPGRPTAVLCGNDLQALGVYEAVRQAGLRIPQDLSVVGFDDIAYTRWCGPPMTTVRQPLVEMGAAAAELAVALAAGPAPRQTRLELATTLVVRDSTAAPVR